MSKKYQPKTEGLEYLLLSLASFNGSKKCVKTDPEAFIKSYINYKIEKKKGEVVDLINEYWFESLEEAERLINRGDFY